MRILVVDDLAIIRDPIVAALNGAGYDAVGAADGAAALSGLKSHKPDLVLLDIQLPDISGLQILRSVRSDPATAQLPVILLSADETRDSIVCAGKLNVQGYLLKSRFSLKELLARMEKYDPARSAQPPSNVACAPASDSRPPGEIPQLLTRDEFLARTKSVLEAKTLSGVVTQVISLATSPRTDLADLAKLVSKDAVLATRVLQAANSAGYRSAKGAVTTIADAIRQVGCSRIRNIAAAVGIFQAMPETSADGFNPIRCWQHSFAVAQLCELLASSSGQNSGAAYLVGLCHDLGEIVLRTVFDKEYQQIIEIEKTTALSRAELEVRMLGMAHSELVSAVLNSFGLPDAVREPIEWFHAAGTANSLGTPGTLEGILRVADWYANGLLLAASETAELSLLTAAQCASAIGTAQPVGPDTQTLRGEIMALTGMLAKLSPAEEAELTKPLLAAGDKNVWVARDAATSPLDSVSAAFSCLTGARLKDRLPTSAETEDLDGLVIAGDKALQESAASLDRVARSALPTLRIIPSKSEHTDPQALRCPIPLAKVHAFCASLAVRGKGRKVA
jgi:HD-like signal output (HDOD) protein/ActR/RegA family two-component response regulator